MLEKLIKNLAKNFIYVVWVIVYFSLAWSILGADRDSFILVFFLYGISILVALSPVGEVLLRFIKKVRPISTREEKEYLLPFLDVFAVLARFIFDIGIIVLSYVSQIILSINSRQNELWADKFAFDIGCGEELAESLYILQKISLPHNMSILDRLRANHPNTAKRIEHLENLLDMQDEKVFITA